MMRKMMRWLNTETTPQSEELVDVKTPQAQNSAGDMAGRSTTGPDWTGFLYWEVKQVPIMRLNAR